MKTISYISVIVKFLVAGALLAACQNVVDNPSVEDFSANGAPTISQITPVDSLDKPITQSQMGKWLTIQGDNLANVTSILFNDIEVNLKDVYAVRNRINVAVPAEAPGNLTNTITVRTTLGEATTNFTILFPKLQVNGLENEFAQPGSNVVVTGEYFKLYGLTNDDATFTLNGESLPVVEKTDKKIVLTIPVNAPDGAKIVINSPKIQEPISLPYRDKGVPLFANYDKTYLFGQGFLWTDQSYITDGTQEGDPKAPIGTSFLRRKNTYSAWNWDTLIAGHFDLTDTDVIDHLENYDIKFEVWTAKTNPLPTGDFIFWSKQSDDKMKLRWNPVSNGVSLNTNGEWRTITLDAQTWFRDNDGEKVLQVGNNDLTIVYQPHNGFDADFGMVNFRFAKKRSK